MPTLLSLLLAAAFAQTLLLLAALHKRRAEDRRTLRFLRAVLVILAGVLSGRLVLESGLVDVPLVAAFVADVILFFVGPALYFTVCALLQVPEPRAQTRWLHLLPAALHLLIITPLAYTQAAGLADPVGATGLQLLYAFTEGAMLVHLGCYLAVAVAQARRYQRGWQQRYRTAAPTSLLTPLLLAGIGLVALWGLGFAGRLLAIPLFSLSYSTLWLLLVGYVFVLAYVLLTDQRVLQLPALLPPSSPVEASLAERVAAYIAQKQPYLRPGLSLDDLAQALDMSRQDVSHVLNHHFGKSFFEYINALRVEEYLRLRALPSGEERTIAELAFEVGFNSRTAFNRAFRKYTGTSPSAYTPSTTSTIGQSGVVG